MKVETALLDASPDSLTNAPCDAIEVRRLGWPWKMENLVLMLSKPPGANMCPVDQSIVILYDTPPRREEMLHHTMQLDNRSGQ